MTTREELDLILDAMYESLNETLEERIVEAFDRPLLSDEEIDEVVEWALGELPPEIYRDGFGIEDYYRDDVGDVIFKAIQKAMERIKS